MSAKWRTGQKGSTEKRYVENEWRTMASAGNGVLCTRENIQETARDKDYFRYWHSRKKLPLIKGKCHARASFEGGMHCVRNKPDLEKNLRNVSCTLFFNSTHF